MSVSSRPSLMCGAVIRNRGKLATLFFILSILTFLYYQFPNSFIATSTSNEKRTVLWINALQLATTEVTPNHVKEIPGAETIFASASLVGHTAEQSTVENTTENAHPPAPAKKNRHDIPFQLRKAASLETQIDSSNARAIINRYKDLSIASINDEWSRTAAAILWKVYIYIYIYILIYILVSILKVRYY